MLVPVYAPTPPKTTFTLFFLRPPTSAPSSLSALTDIMEA